MSWLPSQGLAPPGPNHPRSKYKSASKWRDPHPNCSHSGFEKFVCHGEKIKLQERIRELETLLSAERRAREKATPPILNETELEALSLSRAVQDQEFEELLTERIEREAGRAHRDQQEAGWAEIATLNSRVSEMEEITCGLLADLNKAEMGIYDDVAAHIQTLRARNQADLAAKDRSLLRVWLLAHAQHRYLLRQAPHGAGDRRMQDLITKFQRELQATSGPSADIVKSLPVRKA